MIPVLAATLPVFALILAGWASGRAGVLPAASWTALNAFVVRLALPALLFQFVAEADWRSLWHPGFVLAMSAAIGIVFAGTLLLLGRGRDVAERTIEALAASYANTAFMGIPIAQALYGPTGLAAAVIASLLTIAALFACAILVVEVDRHRGRGPGGAARGVLGSVLRNPLVAAPALGAIWAATGASLPDPVHRVLGLLGATAAPVALVTIGLFLAAAPSGSGHRRPVPLLALKMVGQPLLTWAGCAAMAVPRAWAAPAVLIAALPTGTGPFMLATLYARDAGLVARLILTGTLLSAVTVPLVAWLMR